MCEIPRASVCAGCGPVQRTNGARPASAIGTVIGTGIRPLAQLFVEPYENSA